MNHGWKSWVYIHTSTDMCVCVCMWVCEKQCWKKWRTSWWLGRLQVEDAYWNVSIFMYFFLLFVSMKNTSTAWPVLSPMDNHWSSMCPPTPPPCLLVNGHPSDCQGISQVVQLTLTYTNRVVWGSISSSLVGTGRVWNPVTARMALGVSYSPPPHFWLKMLRLPPLYLLAPL